VPVAKVASDSVVCSESRLAKLFAASAKSLQTVTVTGVDDLVDDGNVNYTIFNSLVSTRGHHRAAGRRCLYQLDHLCLGYRSYEATITQLELLVGPDCIVYLTGNAMNKSPLVYSCVYNHSIRGDH